MIHNTVAPEIYIPSKLHKKDIPLRSIVSIISAPYYTLFKNLSYCLTNINGKIDHYIKNSFPFDTLEIPNDHILLSLNVVSTHKSSQWIYT